MHLAPEPRARDQVRPPRHPWFGRFRRSIASWDSLGRPLGRGSAHSATGRCFQVVDAVAVPCPLPSIPFIRFRFEVSRTPSPRYPAENPASFLFGELEETVATEPLAATWKTTSTECR